MQVPDSERFVAAYVATHPAAMADVVTRGARPEAFQEPECYAVMRAAWRLFERGELTSHNVVRTALKDDGAFSKLGGQAWWSEFIKTGWGDDDLPYHTGRVVRAARIREAGATLRAAQSEVKSAPSMGEKEEAVEEATDRLLKVRAAESTSVYRAEEMRDRFLEALETGRESRLASGIWQLDHITRGWPIGRVSVIAAGSDNGKTAFTDHCALNVALRWEGGGEEKQVVKFDLEQGNDDNQERLVSALVNREYLPVGCDEIRAGEVQDHMSGERSLSSSKLQAVKKAARRLGELPLTLDHQPGADVAYMQARVMAESARREVGLIVVDYAEMIGEKGDKIERVGLAMLKLHEMAKRLGVPILLISQINRSSLSRSSGRPQIGDLSWSDDLRKHAKMVVLLHHPYVHWEQTGRQGEPPLRTNYEVFVAKNKGPKGRCEITFHPDRLTFEDPRDPETGARARYRGQAATPSTEPVF